MRHRRVMALLAVIAVAVAGCGGSDDGDETGGGSVAATEATTTESTATAAAGEGPTNTGADGCDHAEPPAFGEDKQSYDKPGTVLAKGETGTIDMVTSCGSLHIKLDPKRGGPIPNSIAFLAQEGFFDGLTFHRVVPNFVLQGGDPAGDGSGGPGYEVIGPVPTGYQYQVGDIAMAKTQDAPPGTAGSQFFVISGADGASLPTDYGLLGRAGDKESLDTIGRIAALAVSDGPPSQPVFIWSARFHKGP